MMFISYLEITFILVHLGLCFRQPNIVVFLVDDLGYNDVGFRGSNQVKTPNIDALAYNGVVLNRFYSLPSCTPSRTALLTGNYPIRSGMQGVPMSAGEDRFIPWQMPTMPERLKELGYKTHLVGKWHLGSAYRNATPTGRGFDSHYGYWNGYIGYFDHEVGPPGFSGLDMRGDFLPDFETVGQYATDLFTKRAVKIIKGHDYGENPMFLLVSHLAPHTGKIDITINATSVLEERDRAEMDRNFGYIEDENRRRYVDILKSIDDSLGEIMKALSTRGVLEDTMVLFMSDNGGQTFGLHENFASNWPHRGLKFTHFEGGVRGTAVFYSRNVVRKGRINDNLIHMTDWLPTFYKAGWGNTKNLGTIDGVNQLETILFGLPTKRNEILINIDEVDGHVGMLGSKGRYKYINGSAFDGIYDGFYGVTGRERENPPYDVSAVLDSPTNNALRNHRVVPITAKHIARTKSILKSRDCRSDLPTDFRCEPCLFDLTYDPCEKDNIAGKRPEILAELKDKVERFSQELVPQQNKPVDPNANPVNFEGIWSTWLEDKPAK